MRRSLLALALALAALAPLWRAATAAEGVRLLYPPDHSLLAGPVRLMAATAKDADAPTATLDGQPLPLTKLRFADSWQLAGKLKATAKLVGDRADAALWVAAVDLKPGAHTVTVAGQRLELWRAGDAAAPAGYTRFYSHLAVAQGDAKLDCDGCHERPDGTLGPVPTPKACAGCHDEDNVQLIHRHVSPPLARCALCHDPHGTTRAKLLVDEQKALCIRCHEAGHFKP